jgi:hypothetical protein
MVTSFTVGQTQFMTGFCTHAFLLRGKSLSDLEKSLGYRSGRLASGARILFLEQLPQPDDFELAGYTYFSGGAVQGHKLGPGERDANRMEALLNSEHGWSDDQIRKYKQRMIGNKIVISGAERLAKLVACTPNGPLEDYPPGSGVFQLKITRRLLFRVKANIAPSEKWLGDFR